MSSILQIMDLPEKLTTKILSYLTVSDQLECKLVCTKWLEIISTSLEFRKARTINLEYCLLAPEVPPISIFRKSPRKFETLVITQIVYILDETDLNSLWKGISENIEHLKFEYLYDRISLYQTVLKLFGTGNLIANYFPSLKTISFVGKVRRYKDVKDILDAFECIKNKIYINVRTPFFKYLFGGDAFKECSFIFQNIKFPCFYTDQFQLLRNSDALKSLEIMIPEESFEECDELLQNLSQKIKLSVRYSNCIPENVPVRATSVEFYHFEQINASDVNKIFSLIRNLAPHCQKILGLDDGLECLSFHEPLEPKVTFEIDQIECTQCLNALLLSGGILRVFKHKPKWDIKEHIRVLHKHFNNLTTLMLFEKIDCTEIVSILSNASNLQVIHLNNLCEQLLVSWPSMPFLKEFSGTFSNIPEPALRNFATKSSSVEKLTMIISPCTISFPFETFFEHLARLKTLEITLSVLQTDILVKNITKCCFPRLKKLSISNNGTGYGRIYEVRTDVFWKLPSFKALYIQCERVVVANYQTLLIGGSATCPQYELCDETVPLGVKSVKCHLHRVKFRLMAPNEINESMKKYASIE